MNKFFKLLGFSLAVTAAPLAVAQGRFDNDIVHICQIEVDSARLDEYKAYLKEIVETSNKQEPGVRIIYAAFDKEHPNKLTLLEIYDSDAAYQKHLQTPHFQKYKQGTLDMVTSLVFIDCDPLVADLNIKAPVE